MHQWFITILTTISTIICIRLQMLVYFALCVCFRLVASLLIILLMLLKWKTQFINIPYCSIFVTLWLNNFLIQLIFIQKLEPLLDQLKYAMWLYFNPRSTGGAHPSFFLNISVAPQNFPLRFDIFLEPSKCDGMT